MRKLKALFLISLCSLGVACTKPGETTAVGAATGGALGAGVGALIGNQTGNTGEGFVLGAVAGSGAGAAVGNALEAQENAIRLQDEAIERQDRLISTQRSEISELRQRSQDRISFKDDLVRELGEPPVRMQPEVAPGQEFGYEERSANSQAFKEEIPRLNTSNAQPQVGSSGRAALRPASDYSMAMKAPAPEIPAPEPVLKQGSYNAPHNDTEYDSGLTERDLPVNRRVPVLGEVPSQPQGVAPGTAMDQEVAMKPETDGISPDCQKASKEVATANVASEMSDKLFHYRRALRLCPSSADFHNGLGEIYVSLQRYDDARYEFNEALRLNPSLATARSNLLDLPRTY